MVLSFERDDSGVSSTMEFMLSFIVAAAIFSYFVINMNSLFMVAPSDIVQRNQYIDVGNDISTKLIDTYLVAPESGILNVSFEIPDQIVGQSYTVNIIDDNADKEVGVTSDDERVSVYMVLNGAARTIPITGDTSSTDRRHWVKYNYKVTEG